MLPGGPPRRGGGPPAWGGDGSCLVGRSPGRAPGSEHRGEAGPQVRQVRRGLRGRLGRPRLRPRVRPRGGRAVGRRDQGVHRPYAALQGPLDLAAHGVRLPADRRRQGAGRGGHRVTDHPPAPLAAAGDVVTGLRAAQRTPGHGTDARPEDGADTGGDGGSGDRGSQHTAQHHLRGQASGAPAVRRSRRRAGRQRGVQGQHGRASHGAGVGSAADQRLVEVPVETAHRVVGPGRVCAQPGARGDGPVVDPPIQQTADEAVGPGPVGEFLAVLAQERLQVAEQVLFQHLQRRDGLALGSGGLGGEPAQEFRAAVRQQASGRGRAAGEPGVLRGDGRRGRGTGVVVGLLHGTAGEVEQPGRPGCAQQGRNAAGVRQPVHQRGGVLVQAFPYGRGRGGVARPEEAARSRGVVAGRLPAGPVAEHAPGASCGPLQVLRAVQYLGAGEDHQNGTARSGGQGGRGLRGRQVEEFGAAEGENDPVGVQRRGVVDVQRCQGQRAYCDAVEPGAQVGGESLGIRHR
ncbi:gas vesicle protein GvpC [Streptomyces sp. NPDC014891]|uniref:gas vesicle protein GvpC n=1 Tax=Streptomyces sp. NPDC014891 TaxID=3364929 RepID=UPI0036FB7A73